MTSNAKIGLVVGVIVVAGAAFFVVKGRKSGDPAPVSTFKPTTGSAFPKPSGIGSSNPLVAAAVDAGVTPMELRNWHTRIEAERCTQGGERLNTLDGRAPTDPKAINTVSLCLQYGNVAWLACLMDAKDYAAAKTCNLRFLQPPPP